MKLKRFKVTNFRSVEDSGWIDVDDVTTLVGVNESGKSNILSALWKLNPARGGKIDILHDIPVSKQSRLRNEISSVKFIEAEFEVDDASIQNINRTVKCTFEENTTVTISRYYDGHYTTEFDNFPQKYHEDGKGDEQEEERSGSDSSFESSLKTAVIEEMPKFVYYSNYGNLSSKIYLPNVIKWLNGEKVTGIDENEDQVRTLRVLFDFLKLDPEEILELGKDPKDIARERTRNSSSSPSADDIAKAEKDKEQRSILLQSASFDLTKRFKDWWQQGEYRFRFEADGDYFIIWVSDNVRTEEVALELRSTGLQWFLSFYLIFLVERQDSHKNAVLLLDEAGLTLHPLAQKDLAKFFESLSKDNQILHTTHSPFIIDTNNIERCRVVYVDEDGHTVVSSDLRKGGKEISAHSIYAVHAALGLSVSDILLDGCQPVIVEGVSDQNYFNAIKNFLIKEQLIFPKKELVFIPSGGTRGIREIAGIIGGKYEELPFVVVDSDKNGKDFKAKLMSDLYNNNKELIIDICSVTKTENSEVEDIIPYAMIKKAISRMFNNVDDDFDSEYVPDKPLVPQIESFANKHSIVLEQGWKVEMAKSAKNFLKTKVQSDIEQKYLDFWKDLFGKFNV